MPIPVQQESATPSSGRRLALVVGVNGTAVPAAAAYLAPLQAAESGAMEIAQVLQEVCHFEVTTLLGEQATTETVKHALRQLARQSTPHDCLLFYFTGHGYPLLDEAGQSQIALVTHNFDPKDMEELGDDGQPSS